MTQDLKNSDWATGYRERLRVALISGRPFASGDGYSAGEFRLSNPNALRDLLTFADLAGAESEELTFLTLGSFDATAEVVSGSASSAVVSITVTNTTRLGSMLRFSSELYDDYNELGPKIGIDAVTETFTWTEEIRW